MKRPGKISVAVGADTKEFNRKIKGVKKEIGAMGRDLRQGANDFVKWGAAAAAAAAAAGAAFVSANLRNIKELKNLSDAANTSVKVLQRQAFAAQQVGIEQDKFAQILVDTQDRIGDFVTTGAGPMVDFFEQVAPKIGITADAFRNLSGADALQLYVSSLEQANLSQEEMTFFMEALSSDSTRLLPLLRDNGKAMQQQAKAAEDLGIGLSDIDVQAAIDAQLAIDKLTAKLANDSMILVAELAPLIEATVDEVLDLIRATDDFGSASTVVFEGMATGAGKAADALRYIQIGFKTLEVAAFGFTSLVAGAFKGAAEVSTAANNLILEGWVVTFKQMADLLRPFNAALAKSFDQIVEKAEGLKSNVPKFIDDMWDSQMAGGENAQAELQKLVDGPFPSDNIDAFFDRIRERMDEIKARRELEGAEVLMPVDLDAANAALDMLGGTPPGEEGQPQQQQDGVFKTFNLDEYQNETATILEMLGIRLKSQEEMLFESINNELRMLEEKKAKGINLTDEELREKERLEHQFNASKKALTVRAGKDIVSALAATGKAGLKVQQAFALAESGVAIATGIAQANSLPFPLNLAEMARVISTGAQVFSSIRSAKEGAASIPGGASASVGGGGAAPQQSGQRQEPSRIFNVEFVGDSQNSTSQTRQLLEFINEAAGDNVAINIGGG